MLECLNYVCVDTPSLWLKQRSARVSRL